MLNEILTVSEVAEYLRINPQTVYRKAKAGELPAVRIGRAIRFRRTELEVWLQGKALAAGPVSPARGRGFTDTLSGPQRGPALALALTSGQKLKEKEDRAPFALRDGPLTPSPGPDSPAPSAVCLHMLPHDCSSGCIFNDPAHLQ